MSSKIFAISAIVLVAVVMGFGAVASAIPLAYADHPCIPDPDGEVEDHACGNENKPTCKELEEDLVAKGVPRQAIAKLLEHCVD